MTNRVHKWAKGARRPSGVAADEAAQELERIRRERGGLTAEAVVEDAASPESRLHAAFEWNDSKAGHLHRLQQARQLIRAVVTVESGTMPEHRSFILVRSDPEQEETSYMPTVEVVSRADLLGDAVARLRAELRSASESVNQVVSLASAVNAADDRKEKLRSVGERLSEAVVAAESV